MRLIAVSRVLNEDDIIEAFVRHHARLVDHHILLDNGSTDRTIEILRSLSGEGLRITVLQNRAPMFSERLYNTTLYRMAAAEYAADWVLCLDCDEFLDERHAPGGLRARLAAADANEMCLHLPWTRYHPMPDDDAAELVVPRRIRFREVKLVEVYKVCLRGSLAAHGVEVDAGSHNALWQGNGIAAQVAADLPLAHYYARSPWQRLTKAFIGRLKVLAAGQTEISANRSRHYIGTFETLRDNPEVALQEAGVFGTVQPEAEIIEDPIEYGGSELLHTTADDPMMKAARVVAAYAELLAQQHGQMIDSNPAVRMVVENMAGQWTRLV